MSFILPPNVFEFHEWKEKGGGNELNLLLYKYTFKLSLQTNSALWLDQWMTLYIAAKRWRQLLPARSSVDVINAHVKLERMRCSRSFHIRAFEWMRMYSLSPRQHWQIPKCVYSHVVDILRNSVNFSDSVVFKHKRWEVLRYCSVLCDCKSCHSRRSSKHL